MNRSDYLSINTKDTFYPMSITTFIFKRACLRIKPYWIFYSRIMILEIKFRIAISETDQHLVDVMLILHYVEVTTYTSIQTFRLDRFLCFRILVLSITSTKFKRREILSFQVQSEKCLILTIVRHLPLDCAKQIHSSHRSLKQSRCVFGYLNLFLS